MNRRRFLQILGGAVGTAYLVGCGGTGSTSGGAGPLGPTPTAYAFFPIAENSLLGPDFLPRTCNALVQLSDLGDLFFQAVDPTGRAGLYVASLSFAGVAPVVQAVRTVVSPGQAGVTSLGCHDINRAGTAAVVVRDEQGLEGILLVRRTGEIQPVMRALDPAPNGGLLASSFGPLSLSEGDDLLATAGYVPREGPGPSLRALVHLAGGQASGASTLLASGQAVAGLSQPLGRFALCGLGEGGVYLVQAVAAPDAPAVLLQGTVGSASDPQVLVAPTELATPPGPVTVGRSVLGPRAGAGGRTAHVATLEPGIVEVHVDGQRILRTGDALPDGEFVSALPPEPGPFGLTFLHLHTRNGAGVQSRLAFHDGQQLRTLLRTGDPLGGRTVLGFSFGYMSGQVDSSGRLAMAVRYTDGSRGLVVGVPV